MSFVVRSSSGAQRAVLRGVIAAVLAAWTALSFAGPRAGDAPVEAAAAAWRSEAEPVSADARQVAAWAVASGNTEGLPFIVVDKNASSVYVFDAQGDLRGATPALVGAARGDDSVPGIGSRPIASIRPEERTTPAGRYRATMGHGPKGEDILWVDYEGALALHRVVTNVPQERRLQRLASKIPAERRITFGCINVPAAFFDRVVVPTFGGTAGIVYILPESRSVGEMFGVPALQPTSAR